MRLLAGLRDADRRLTQQGAACCPPALGKARSAEQAAEDSTLWCGVAVVMAVFGGWRGRRAAASGVASLAVAQLVSNGLCKQLANRPRPPRKWFPHDEVEVRPQSSSFPSGHTAAAVAFTTAVASTWPLAGALSAVPAVMVAAERVQSGAHYPSDVATGALIGPAGAWLTRHTPHVLLRHRLRSGLPW